MEGFHAKGRPSAARAAWYTPKLSRKPRTADHVIGQGEGGWLPGTSGSGNSTMHSHSHTSAPSSQVRDSTCVACAQHADHSGRSARSRHSAHLWR